MLERDLRKVRAKQAERERAAGILTKPAGVMKDQSPRLEVKKSPTAAVKGLAERGVAAQSVQPTDTEPMDEPTAVVLPKPDPQASQGQLPITGGQATDLAPNKTSVMEPQNLDPTAGLAVTLQPDSQVSRKSSPKPEAKTEETPIGQPPNNGGEDQPPANHQEPAPFESMFNDLQNPSNPTSLVDFDLGFPTAGSLPQDLLNDAVFDTMGSSNDDQNLTLTLPSTTAEDIDSLLPGLEKYVTNDGDFALIDMNLPTAAPEISGLQNTSVPAAAAADSGAQPQQSLDSAPIESNFDDLFGSGDWNIDDELGGGTLDDFNEDWFKNDG